MWTQVARGSALTLLRGTLQRVTGPLHLSPHLLALSYLPHVVTTVTATSVSWPMQAWTGPVLSTSLL